MSAISAVSAAKATAPTDATDTSSTASRVPQKTLGQNDFLKLLAKQFQTQDPMKPMEDTAFIAQMAQFSSLEQSKTMSADMAALRSDQQRAAANSYLGHRVTVDDGNKGTAVGDVSAVDARGTEPQLVINGVSYPLSSVLLVEPGSVTTPQPVPSTGA